VAAHSHHPWPDVSYDAQIAAWNEAAQLLDRKWNHIYDHVIPEAQGHIARQLNLPDPTTIAFGPNTHGFVLRLLSCLPAPARILTTDSEFMSFARQIARLEEDGLVTVTRVPVRPFGDFEARFAQAAADGTYDLVFFSQVFFDSGYAITDPAAIVRAVQRDETLIVIDGYHAFMARPTNVSSIAARVFYLAGGYKYAMAGEGVCFLHCPPGYGARPRDTGWFAGFSGLEAGGGSVSYPVDGSRFLGATFDLSGLYRFNAVQNWLFRENFSVPVMLGHVRTLEQHFLTAIAEGRHSISPAMLRVPDAERRGRFLAFTAPNAAEIVARLAEQNIIADHRGDILRIGFGIYHGEHDIVRLGDALSD
jgi:selenocysteine lyase/cysteine desulfurase